MSLDPDDVMDCEDALAEVNSTPDPGAEAVSELELLPKIPSDGEGTFAVDEVADIEPDELVPDSDNALLGSVAWLPEGRAFELDKLSDPEIGPTVLLSVAARDVEEAPWDAVDIEPGDERPEDVPLVGSESVGCSGLFVDSAPLFGFELTLLELG